MSVEISDEIADEPDMRDKENAEKAGVYFQLGLATGELMKQGVPFIGLHELAMLVEGHTWDEVKAHHSATTSVLNEVITRPVGQDCRKSRLKCPACGQNCSTVALNKLLYVFETCRCDRLPYAHLVEQIWHKTCFEAD